MKILCLTQIYTTYIKEIIDGNSVITLADEEKEALDMAMHMNEHKE